MNTAKGSARQQTAQAPKPKRKLSRWKIILGAVAALIVLNILFNIIGGIRHNAPTKSLDEVSVYIDGLAQGLRDALPAEVASAFSKVEKSRNSEVQDCYKSNGMFDENRSRTGKQYMYRDYTIDSYAGTDANNLFSTIESYLATQGYSVHDRNLYDMKMRNDGYQVSINNVQEDKMWVSILSPCVWPDGTKNSSVKGPYE